MSKLNLTYSFCLLFLCIISAKAQIVDDSTETNISFSQTKYFTKHDVYVEDTIRRSINEQERFDLFQYSFNDASLLQDLGMYGSAGRLLFVPYNKSLGSFDGISTYDYLAFKDEEVRYYDTKVPFSQLGFRQNFGGASWANGLYTQSLGDVANVGFELKRFTTPLNFGSNPLNETYGEHISGNLHASFIAPNKLYKALLNYRFMHQTTAENGGAFIDYNQMDTDSLIVQNVIEKSLEGAISQEKRNEWSFYQELSPFKNGELKLFHSLDRMKKVNSYEDNNLITNQAYYPDFYQSTSATKDSNVYRVIENKVGLSGRLKQVSYAAYLKNRLWKYEADTNLWDTASVTIQRKNDLYAGGDLFYQTKARDVNARLNFEIGLDETRKFDFVSDFKFVKLKYLDLKNLSTLRQRDYDENHYSWSNDFVPYTLREMRIEPYYRKKNFYVSAFWSKQEYSNFVYYNENLVPVQDSAKVSGQFFGVNAVLKVKKWKFDQVLKISKAKELIFMPVPEVYTHTNINYYFKVRKLSSLKGMVGADFYYFSKYKPLAYRSDLQNFVVQNYFEEKGYLVFDAYVNFKYKTVNVSLKVINLLQGVASNNGYYPTPGYFGRKRGFELGLNWSFFR